MREEGKRRYLYIDNVPRTAQEPVGYCWNALHPGMLSKGLVKSHSCLDKQCKYFEKYTLSANQFWEERNLKKEKSKEKKKLYKMYLNRKISLRQYKEWCRMVDERRR